jgi:hypothetical protein
MATSYPAETFEDLGRSSPVEWSRYANGSVWKLTRGVDFDQSQTAWKARKAFINWAGRQDPKFSTHTRVEDDHVLYVQAVPRVVED